MSRKTNWLVAGASAGSKLATAERLGVPVLDEDALLAYLGDPLTLGTYDDGNGSAANAQPELMPGR